jgi:hypothetical protein
MNASTAVHVTDVPIHPRNRTAPLPVHPPSSGPFDVFAVQTYVKSGKNDANDAEAICRGSQPPTMRFCADKKLQNSR